MIVINSLAFSFESASQPFDASAFHHSGLHIRFCFQESHCCCPWSTELPLLWISGGWCFFCWIIVICNFLLMPLQVLWVTLLPQMLLSLWLTCSHTGPYSLVQCSLFFWHIFLLIDADFFPVRGFKARLHALKACLVRETIESHSFQCSRHTLPLAFDACYHGCFGCFEWCLSWIAHNAVSKPQFS